LRFDDVNRGAEEYDSIGVIGENEEYEESSQESSPASSVGDSEDDGEDLFIPVSDFTFSHPDDE
jgi:hypothetical protein